MVQKGAFSSYQGQNPHIKQQNEIKNNLEHQKILDSVAGTPARKKYIKDMDDQVLMDEYALRSR